MLMYVDVSKELNVSTEYTNSQDYLLYPLPYLLLYHYKRLECNELSLILCYLHHLIMY